MNVLNPTATLILAVCMLIACTNSSKATQEETETETTTETQKMMVQNAGLALYTVRDRMAADPKGVLKQVAEIGYKNIEVAGYEDGKFYGMPPAEFKAYLAEIGLEATSSHHGGVTLDNADQQIADAVAVGFKYFVIPIPPMGHFSSEADTLAMSDEVETVMDIINTIGAKCAAAGIQCLYHNHDFEFKPKANGVVPMDYFIEHSNPEHVNFELDLYWAIKAGVDPIVYFEKAKGRIKAWHVKDMDEQGRFAPVGTGTIDFSRFWPKRALAGLETYFVEQDRTYTHTPMEAVQISYDGLGKFGFE